MQRPRMLVLDLDGTTLTDDKTITPRDRAAARALREAGVHLTLATGRLFTGARWVAQELGIEGTIAAMNGSELIDVESEQVRHGRYLDAEARETVRGVLAYTDLATVLFRSRQLHYDRRHAAHHGYLATWTADLTAHDALLAGPVWEAGAEDLLAVGTIGDATVATEVRRALAATLRPEYELVVFGAWGELFVKVRHCAEDKGTALVRMAAERGWTAEDCVAVGDWTNDLPMLRAAGRSFAMGGADAEVCAAADGVLDARAGAGGAVAEVARRVWDLDV